MIWFIIICLLLVVAVLASLVLSVHNGRRETTDLVQQTALATRQENITITRERLKQLPAGAEFDQARLELEAALADDLGKLSESKPDISPAQHGRGSAYAALLIVPVAALAIYLSLGNTRWLDRDGLPTMAEIRDHPEASLDMLVQRLEETLENEPDNLDGWMLAARTYISMGRLKDGENAWAKANQLQPDNADLLAAWADASLLANGNRFTSDIESRVTRSLELNPQHVNALWIAGMGNYTNGKPGKALSYLSRLQPLLAAQPEVQQQVGQIVDQLNTNLVASSEQDGTNRTPSRPVGRQIEVTVSTTPELMNRMDDSQTVFVFARAIDGPEFPLAVARLQVADLPATVILDDNNAMIAGQSISAYEKVMVAARISMSGEPVAKPGDLTSDGTEVSIDGDARVDLQIDRRVE